MTLMMIYKPFSIVAVPFPFTDIADVKRRPAVVLSSEHHQKNTKHITLLMITSAKHSHWYDDYIITDLKSAGLSASSLIRQKIFTLDIHLILDCIGKLSTKDKDALIKIIQQHLKSII